MQVLDHLALHRAYQLDLVRGESLNLRKHIQVVMQCQVFSRQIDCDFVSLEHQQGSALEHSVATSLKVSRYAILVYMAISLSFVVRVFPRKCSDVQM